MDETRGTTVPNGQDARLSRRGALPRLGAAALAAVTVARTEIASAEDGATVATAGRAGYVVIRRYRLRPETAYDDVTRLVETELIPMISVLPGFIEYILVEPGAGEHVVISIFADQESADESAAIAGAWAQERVDDLAEIPAYEVIAGPVGLDVTVETPATPVP